MPGKPKKVTKTPKKQSQLDRIEAKVEHVVARVDKLERRASVWGAIGGVVTALATNLAGCF